MKRLLTLSTILVLTITIGFADRSKIADDLLAAAQYKADATHKVIVQTNGPPSSEYRMLLGKRQNVRHTFAAINGYLAELTASEIEALSDDPEIAYIAPDREVQSFMDVTAPTVGATYAFTSEQL